MSKLDTVYTCDTMNMILELTNACNMRCKYCFENSQTEERNTIVITEEILRKSIDFLIDGRTNCHLTFFGGEPMLCKDQILFSMDYGNKVAHDAGKYIAYTVVTNGTLIDDKMLGELNRNNVNIVFSFDGNEVSQNKYRPMADGTDSYNLVVDNLKKIVQSRADERFGHLIIRPTITSEMIPHLNDIYKELIDIGCREVSFSLVSSKKEDLYSIKDNDMKILDSVLRKMCDSYYIELKKGNSHNKYFEAILSNIATGRVNCDFCDCGKRYIAIDAKGDIYPCEGFIGVEEYRLGSIVEDRVDKVFESPQKVDDNDECRGCWAKYLCGGSCYHEAWMRTGSVNCRDKLVCETYRKSFEHALILYSRLLDECFDFNLITSQGLLPERSVPLIRNEAIKVFSEDKVLVNGELDYRIVKLNDTAFRIMELCDGNTTVADITSVITSEYHCDDVYADISETIDTFIDEGIARLTI